MTASQSSAISEEMLINGVPRDWIGIRSGNQFKADNAFPCIGLGCRQRGEFHPAGTVAQGFRDFVAYKGQACEWQHMCALCADSEAAEQEWRVRFEVRRLQRTSCGHIDEWPDEAAMAAVVDEAEEDAAIAQALEAHNAAAAATAAAVPPPPLTPAAPTAAELAPAYAAGPNATPATQPVAPELLPAEPRFLTHAEERLRLGKPLWQEIAAKVPRAQHDGSLRMPAGGSAPSNALRTLENDFPELPFIKPKPAAMRAAALLQESADGRWTPELRERARACFESEAAGIELALCMPEVVARDELLRHAPYQVKDSDGRVSGCKVPCPGCKSNAFVLTHKLNVDAESRVRFAHGNNRAIMPISRGYVCVLRIAYCVLRIFRAYCVSFGCLCVLRIAYCVICVLRIAYFLSVLRILWLPLRIAYCVLY